MKIAILGNGKMGKQIIELATKKGHHIICIANSKTPTKSINLKLADVAIDFSTPNTAFENISHAINSGIPVISGTTGWLDRLQNIKNLCLKKGGAFLYAPNFSLAANIFFELNEKLAILMKEHNYKTTIHEVHHTEKLDKPSGTAYLLAEKMNKILKNKTSITSDRVNEITGIHQVIYSSDIDKIKIEHTAKNRDGFAMGAIIAAEWIIGKNGIYNLTDILKK
tara:strand:+ start:303 stop:971 length:669 start_codon:yes stop_codon:yes gene_type:complete